MSKLDITAARIYDDFEGSDPRTLRVLVDRLWPRGVSREQAAIDVWPKDATPSTELRKSWHSDASGHEAKHFEAFKEAYRKELEAESARNALVDLAQAVADSPRTVLLTAAKDLEMSHVPVILEALKSALHSR